MKKFELKKSSNHKLKKLLKLGHVVEIKPTNIIVGKFNFRLGDVDKYNFTVQYINKMLCKDGGGEKDYSSQKVRVYGIIHFNSGASYKEWVDLTYTDDSEIDKLIDLVEGGRHAEVTPDVLRQF